MKKKKQQFREIKIDTWLRVCINTIVRKTEDIDSERLKILAMGQRVHAIGRKDRRLRIDSPVTGWVSLYSAHGDVILQAVRRVDEDLSSPKAEDSNDRLQKLREKIASVEKQEELAKQQRERALSIDEVQEAVENVEYAGLKLKLSEANSENARILRELNNSKTRINLLETQQAEFDVLQAELANICSKHGVRNPRSIAEEINQLAQDRDRLKEYEIMADQYKKELDAMRKKMQKLLYQQSSHNLEGPELNIGDVVMMKNDVGIGIVQYLGAVQFDETQMYVGLELSGPFGKCDGSFAGKKYFSVKPKHGDFYPLHMVHHKIKPAALLGELHKQISLVERLSSSKE